MGRFPRRFTFLRQINERIGFTCRALRHCHLLICRKKAVVQIDHRSHQPASGHFQLRRGKRSSSIGTFYLSHSGQSQSFIHCPLTHILVDSVVRNKSRRRASRAALRIQILIVVHNIRQECRTRNPAVERSHFAVCHTRRESRLICFSATNGFIQRNRDRPLCINTTRRQRRDRQNHFSYPATQEHHL